MANGTSRAPPVAVTCTFAGVACPFATWMSEKRARSSWKPAGRAGHFTGRSFSAISVPNVSSTLVANGEISRPRNPCVPQNVLPRVWRRKSCIRVMPVPAPQRRLPYMYAQASAP